MQQCEQIWLGPFKGEFYVALCRLEGVTYWFTVKNIFVEVFREGQGCLVQDTAGHFDAYNMADPFVDK